MQILTVSIDGQSRESLAAALGEVLALVQGGIDTSAYQNQQLSYSFAIKEYDLPADERVPASLRAAAQHQDAAERARYKYLPADKLMAAAGYDQPQYGRYIQRPAGEMWPFYQVSFFSESGTCVLQKMPSNRHECKTVAAQVVTSDEQLQQFLQLHEFPPIAAGLVQPTAEQLGMLSQVNEQLAGLTRPKIVGE